MKITNSIELLDWFRESQKLSSDYMVAKLTGLSNQMLSDVRKEKTEFSDSTTLMLLAVGNHPNPLKTMALLESLKYERKGKDKLAKLWREHSK